MSNQSKAVVAVCIVAGIVGLIVFDLAMSPGKKSASTPAQAAGDDSRTIGLNPTPPVTFPLEPELPIPKKGANEDTGNDPAPVPSIEKYSVRQGDNIWSIAKAKYGDGAEWKRIAEANPNMNPQSLKVGMELVIPGKPKALKGSKAIPGQENSQMYTVQAGETLSTISTKFYKTVKYAKTILEANKELIKTADKVKAGMQIVIPQIKEATTAAVPSGSAPPETRTDPAPATPKTYKVKQGDSLWKIANSINPQHVNDTMDKIVKANGDKLRLKTDSLRVDWELVIPD